MTRKNSSNTFGQSYPSALPSYSNKVIACSPLSQQGRTSTPTASPASRLSTPTATRLPVLNLPQQQKEETEHRQLSLSPTRTTQKDQIANSGMNEDEQQRQESDETILTTKNISPHTDVAFYLQETANDDSSIDLMLESKDEDDDDKCAKGDSDQNSVEVSSRAISKQSGQEPEIESSTRGKERKEVEQDHEIKLQATTDVSFYLEDGFDDTASAEIVVPNAQQEAEEEEEDSVEKIASSSRRIDMDGAIRHKVVLYSEMNDGTISTPMSQVVEEAESPATPTPTNASTQEPHPASKIRIRKGNSIAASSSEETSHSEEVADENVATVVDATVSPQHSLTQPSRQSVNNNMTEPVGCGCGLFRSSRKRV